MSEQDLEFSNLTGQWGFQYQTAPLAAVQSGDLLQFQLAPHLARTWTVHLNAFRFSKGVLGLAGPPDNQTDTSEQMRVAVQWGVDSGNESAVVDYYARGCTFQVHASWLRLQVTSLVNLGSTAPPLLSGYVAPAPERGTPRHPTFTTGRNNQNASTAVLYPLPARALGYRIMPAVRNGASNVISLQQCDGNGVTLTDDGQMDFLGFFVGSAGLLAPAYYPLHPQAQFLQVTTQANPVSSVFAIVHQLDLG